MVKYSNKQLPRKLHGYSVVEKPLIPTVNYPENGRPCQTTFCTLSTFCRFIRRYGTGQGLFLVEVGRGAASGEGLFKFRTTTPDQIQTAVNARMNHGSRRCTTPAAVEDLYATVNKPKRNSDKV